MPHHTTEGVEALKARVARRDEELTLIRKNLKLAVEKGNELIAENGRLTNKLKEYEEAKEDFKQKSYSLQRKLDSANALQKHHNEEINALQYKIEIERKDVRCQLEKESVTKLQKLEAKISELQSVGRKSKGENDSMRKNVDDLKMKLRILHDEKDEWKMQLPILHEEMRVLEARNLHLENEWKVNEENRNEEQEKLSHHLQQKTGALTTKITQLEEMIDMEKCKSKDYMQMNEKLREELAEKNYEAEVMKSQQKPSCGQGNSIFAEVEMNRIKMEGKIVKFQEANKDLNEDLVSARFQIEQLTCELDRQKLLNEEGSCGVKEKLKMYADLVEEFRHSQKQYLYELEVLETQVLKNADRLNALCSERNVPPTVTMVLTSEQSEVEPEDEDARLLAVMHAQSTDLMTENQMLRKDRAALHIQIEGTRFAKMALLEETESLKKKLKCQERTSQRLQDNKQMSSRRITITKIKN